MRDTNLGVAGTVTPTAVRPYYEDLGVGHDYLLRCQDCGKLVAHVDLVDPKRKGLTPCCGTRRVREIRSLKWWEWLMIRVGIIDFPYRKEFLAEFKRV